MIELQAVLLSVDSDSFVISVNNDNDVSFSASYSTAQIAFSAEHVLSNSTDCFSRLIRDINNANDVSALIGKVYSDSDTRLSARINFRDDVLDVTACEEYALSAVNNAVNDLTGLAQVSTEVHALNALAVDCLRVNGFTVIKQDDMINVFTACNFVCHVKCVSLKTANKVFLSLAETFTNVTNARW